MTLTNLLDEVGIKHVDHGAERHAEFVEENNL